MRELFLFIRPPRPLWPFNGPASAVWPPLAFASLAAALRERIGDLRIAILDAPALHMGWRTMENELRSLRPAYVGIGEEAVSCVEGLRLARMAKELGARVIAGGCFFSHVPAQAIQTGLVDVVVHGEGETTIGELVMALRSGKVQDLNDVAGISFGDEQTIRRTAPRALLPDLDRLPIPAYDLLPVERYGCGSRNHPDLAAIELGRGCVGSCSFCVLWRQMGQQRQSGLFPQLRTKSPERLLDEIRILRSKYGRRFLAWVDPCFNAHPEVPRQLAELLLRENLRIGQSAWVRADAIVRDAGSGALASCIRAGLNEVHLGFERVDPGTLHALHKTVAPDDGRQALEILTRDHPEVFTVGSFIYGLPGETPRTLWDLHRLSAELGLDQRFFIPLTPLPGTPFWKPDMWDPSGTSFRSFGFLPGQLRNGDSAVLERTQLLAEQFCWNRARLRSCIRALWHCSERKRRMARRLFVRSILFEAGRMFKLMVGLQQACGLYFPRWYNS
jgi:anaerobic magnesium-protoporphyrin IX monomethyl ester cyclase